MAHEPVHDLRMSHIGGTRDVEGSHAALSQEVSLAASTVAFPAQTRDPARRLKRPQTFYRVLALIGKVAFHSWARHFTLAIRLSIFVRR